jgi:hypothetical protein
MKKRNYAICIAATTILALSVLGYTIKALKAKKPERRPDIATVHYPRSSHDRNPIASETSLPGDEDASSLNNILKTIFPHGWASLSDEEKSIEILKYVSSSLKLKGGAEGGTATKIIKDGVALCVGMARVFNMLCRSIGMAARPCSAKYLPTLDSHVVAEVFYDGQWHLFDPTFGLFFYSNPDYDRTGHIISFHEFLSRPQEGTAFKVVSKPWKGEYDKEAKNFAVTRAEDDYLESKYGRPLIPVYRKEMSEAFPVAYGNNDLISYPVDADLSTVVEQWFGKMDDSYDDLIFFGSKYSDRYKAHFFGNNSLGETCYHTWLIKAPAGSLIAIDYYSLRDDPPALTPAPQRAVRLIQTEREGRRTTFIFYVNDDEAILSVYCPDGTFLIDAMRASKP